MAVPKRKMSKARRDSRRANWKLEAPGFVSCPQCHEPKMPHHVCTECGYYDGKVVYLNGKLVKEEKKAAPAEKKAPAKKPAKKAAPKAE